MFITNADFNAILQSEKVWCSMYVYVYVCMCVFSYVCVCVCSVCVYVCARVS